MYSVCITVYAGIFAYNLSHAEHVQFAFVSSYPLLLSVVPSAILTACYIVHLRLARSLQIVFHLWPHKLTFQTYTHNMRRTPNKYKIIKQKSTEPHNHLIWMCLYSIIIITMISMLRWTILAVRCALCTGHIVDVVSYVLRFKFYVFNTSHLSTLNELLM